jgi:hypothetical protein
MVADISTASLPPTSATTTPRDPTGKLDLRVPECFHPVAPVDEVPQIERRDVLGGLIHEYHAVAA